MFDLRLQEKRKVLCKKYKVNALLNCLFQKRDINMRFYVIKGPFFKL